MLLSISMFWQNDQLGGIGLQVHNDPLHPLEPALAQIRAMYDGMYKEEDDKNFLLADLRAQLPHFRLDLTTNWHLIYGNIYLLQKHGRMPNDEFNGFVYHWDHMCVV